MNNFEVHPTMNEGIFCEVAVNMSCNVLLVMFPAVMSIVVSTCC